MACLQATTPRRPVLSDLDARILGWLKWHNARGWHPTARRLARKAGCTEAQVTGTLFRLRGPVIKDHEAGTYRLEEPQEVIVSQLSPAELFSLWREYGEPRSPEEVEKIRIALRTRVLHMGPTVLMDPEAADEEILAALSNGRFRLRGDGAALVKGVAM